MTTRRFPVVTALALALACSASCKKKEEEAPAKAGEAPKVAEAPKAAPAPALPAGDGSNPAVDQAVARALSYAPAGAAVVFGMDFKGLAKSPIWPEAKKAAEMDPKNVKRMAALMACGLPLEGFGSLVAVGDNESHGLAVVSGSGLGKRTTLECLKKAFAEELPDDKVRLEDKDGRTRIVGEGDVIGLLADDDTIVVVHKDWADAVDKRIVAGGPDDGGKALEPILARVDRSKAIWIAARIPEAERAKATEGPGKGLVEVVATLDVAGGLAAKIDGRYDSPELAKAAKTEIERGWTEMKPMTAMFGIPPQVADKLKFTEQGDVATATISLTPDELKQITASMNKIAESAAAAGGAPPPGAPPTPGVAVEPKKPGKGGK